MNFQLVFAPCCPESRCVHCVL